MALADAPEIPGFRAPSALGHGPTSTVYSAQSLTLGRWVAVTVYSVTLRDEQAQRRFRRGYEVSRRLGAHPHAVTVLELGATPDGQPYVVTEIYEHGTLDNQIQSRQPSSVGEVLRMGIALAGALETSHRAGIIHGGIHPARILLAEDREPALADLGLVPLVDRTGLAALAGPMTCHAPPEVLEGESLVPATDVYALASTLYATLTGRAPYAPSPSDGVGEEDTTASLLLRILQHDIPAIDRRDVPPSLEKTLDQALSSEARYRPPRPLAFAQALQACQVELGLAPSQPVVLDIPATLNAVDADPVGERSASPAPSISPPSTPSTPSPSSTNGAGPGRSAGWTQPSLPPPPELPEVRLPSSRATFSPPPTPTRTPAATPAPTPTPAPIRTPTPEPRPTTSASAAPDLAEAPPSPPSPPAARLAPAVPLPGPVASPVPEQVFIPYSPPEMEEFEPPPAPAALSASAVDLRPAPAPSRPEPVRPVQPVADRLLEPDTWGSPPPEPELRRPPEAVASEAEFSPRTRALPVIVLAVLVAVIFAGVTWSIVAGEGSEDERAQPGSTDSADPTTGPQGATPGGLTAVESSVGVQLDWDGNSQEPHVVVIFSTAEPPRTLPADAGTALLIPTANLDPAAGYCFAVVAAPAPTPPVPELAAQVPNEALGPDACIRSGSVDTIRRS